MKSSQVKVLNRAVDFLMLLLLPLLMAYSLIGEAFHEITGTIIFILFILHHVLHLNWLKAVFKGKYTAYRTCITAVNLILLVLMFLQPLSGIAVSNHLYTFLPLTGIASWARSIHMAAAYWCYVLMSFHLGLHTDVMLRKLNQRLEEKRIVKWLLRLAVWAVSIYGIYAFVKRDFFGYMFMRILFVFFDYSEPRLYFFADYLAIMVLFTVCGYYTVKALKRQKAGK